MKYQLSYGLEHADLCSFDSASSALADVQTQLPKAVLWPFKANMIAVFRDPEAVAKWDDRTPGVAKPGRTDGVVCWIHRSA